MNFLNKFFTIGILVATLTITTASVQAMEERESERISVAQFKALSFDEMKERIENRLNQISQKFNPKLAHNECYIKMIRTLLDGVSNGATSKEQLAVITNLAIENGGNSGTGLFKACNLREYLIAQFILYRAGITGDDLIELLGLDCNDWVTVLHCATISGSAFVALILNHPIFQEPKNKDKFVHSILACNQKNGITILHFVALMTQNLDVVKKLIGKLLERVDSKTLLPFIHAPYLSKNNALDYWQNKTAAQIAKETYHPNLQMAEFLENFTEERIVCELKARKEPKRYVTLYEQRKPEENKSRDIKIEVQYVSEIFCAAIKLLNETVETDGLE